MTADPSSTPVSILFEDLRDRADRLQAGQFQISQRIGNLVAKIQRRPDLEALAGILAGHDPFAVMVPTLQRLSADLSGPKITGVGHKLRELDMALTEFAAEREASRSLVARLLPRLKTDGARAELAGILAGTPLADAVLLHNAAVATVPMNCQGTLDSGTYAHLTHD